MEKTGRKEPCPCGSGKKYKRCCLARGKAVEDFTQDDRRSAIGALEDFVARKLELEDEEASAEFYGAWEDRLDELGDDWIRASEEVYDMWFFCDRPLDDGRRVVDVFLERGRLLGPGVRRYLAMLRETALRLYEIEDLSPGESIAFRELPSGARVTVHERTGSRSLWRHALVAARIIGRGPSGRPEIEQGMISIPELLKEQVLSQLADQREAYRRRQPANGENEFFKEMAPFFHEVWISSLLEPQLPRLANTDGEDLLITRTRFDVADPAAMESAFAKAKELEREESGGRVWLWCGANREGKPVILGRLAMKDDSLELECNSAARGERGRALIETLAGGLVRHRSTVHENAAAAVRDMIRSRTAADEDEAEVEPEPDAFPREVQEDLVLDEYGRAYRKWIDEPIPALEDHTPRDAARDARLRPKLADLIRGLEGMYQRSLKEGKPAYDPSWMWGELGLAEGSTPAHPPPLAYERMAAMAPGIGDLCRTAAEKARRQAGFDDASTAVTIEEMKRDLEIQRFLRRPGTEPAPVSGLPVSCEHRGASLEGHILFMTNFELHRRKTFWVDESLVYMLAKTDLDVVGRELRMPFPCFALVFTDRYALSLAERTLSLDRHCPLAGQFLKAATVYIVEEPEASNRILHVGFALDALGVDRPHLIAHEVPLGDEDPVRRFLDDLAPQRILSPSVPLSHPLRGLFHLVFNAILYATSAGVDPQLRSSPEPRSRSKQAPQVFSSESVFFLPGAIEISRVRKLQELERVSSGRQILHRFMVRGHWRQAAASWKDQRMRWIEPYWKGPDIAAVIERAYKLKP